MAITSGALVLLQGIIWVVCILLGIGLGTLLGRWVGTLLGWMIATSLDANISNGGRFGKRVGIYLGIGAGICIALYYAAQLSAIVLHQIAAL
ncbi:hypothetical protein [Dictyobacter arantiisoli]|uniref:Uncharacterized protein n=1 Tax=Dictyobacter arantiisoli TaxID=2014874 RepID=A0A5A5TIN6_9CHLR|nr:hypothetical protein [Dictyobacter arantiisoli]GCF11085.1 hypothetical protein KDI_46490 [Dictyobacter arantiisoli]